MNLKPSRNNYDYENFLKGSEGWVWDDGLGDRKYIFDENLTHVDYLDVTLNLGDYWIGDGVVGDYVGAIMRNGSLTDGEFIYHDESFSGFSAWKDTSQNFEKCFEIRPSTPDHLVEMTLFGYNLSAIWNDLGGPSGVSYSIHYPGQHLLQPDYAAPDEFDFGSENQNFFLRIKDIEIIQSRNSRKRKCTDYENKKQFDNMVREKHIMTNKCRAPYFKPFQDFPKCSTKESLRKSHYDYKTARKKYYPASCQRLSKIAYEVAKNEFALDVDESFRLWGFGLIYPDHIRIIKQSKEVDIHSLIGNIGGYIGLFLGNIFSLLR